ncbi:unnamed protein product [Protopolystoma xenopodis]|uniref:Uncharacterized protein n=1 Tax=Protopolystoma xenopodis TaxID=117903 RepID=A0A448WHA0_9PLAT|nr:unnamed protein product [Protopolystoma xenopodis]
MKDFLIEFSPVAIEAYLCQKCRAPCLFSYNVTSKAVKDPSLPGFRPILSACNTFEPHGHFPSMELFPSVSETRSSTGTDFVVADSDGSDLFSTKPSQTGWQMGEPHVEASADHRSVSQEYWERNDYIQGLEGANRGEGRRGVGSELDEQELFKVDLDSGPVVACLEPARLPGLFGAEWNSQLASPRFEFFEENCRDLKQTCKDCLLSCAEDLRYISEGCKPTAGPGDNGRSPRLARCFDCCVNANCTHVCNKYPSHRCQRQLCSHGMSAIY